MTSQFDFFDQLAGPTAPAVALADLDKLKVILTGVGWQSCKSISESSGWSDRKVRSLAQASEGSVISGQRGYHLTSEATPDEIHHAWTWLAHQGDAMRLRANQIRTFAHQQIA